jgi:DNA-binding NtrC family response regulator
MVDDSRLATSGILVVDDDQMLLGLLKTVLVRRGFNVWTAASGHSAVDVYHRQQRDIDLVLLDVCMPGMDGPHTLAQLRHINPSLRSCFMSGHPGSYTLADLGKMGSLHFFEKPFQILPLADELWQLARAGERRAA